MAALTANSDRANRLRGGTARKVASSTVFAGAFVGINSNGLVVPWANTAGLQWLGVAQDKIVGTASATDIVQVDESGIILESIAVTGVTAESDQGRLIYASTDNDLTLTSQSNTKPVGKILRRVSGTSSDVQLFTPDEYANNQFIPITLPKLTADAASTTTTSGIVMASFQKGGFVESIKIHPSSALTSNASNFASFEFIKRSAAGASIAALATMTTSGTTWTAFATVSAGSLSNNTFSAGEKLVVEIKKTANGVIVPISVFEANALNFR